MSGFKAIGYAMVANAYGLLGVVNLANPVATYTCKPQDYAILIDLSGYDGAGPTINWCPTPEDDFPVLIRNVAGSAAANAITVNAPAGMTIEDPANPRTFAATIVLNAASGFDFGVWIVDRKNNRLVLYFESVTVGSPAAVHVVQSNNPGVVGPDISPAPTDFEVSFTANGSGVLLVIASMTIGAQAAGDPVSFHLSKDGAFVAVIVQVEEAGAAAGVLPAGGFPASATLMGTFVVTVGVAHTFGIQAVNLINGNTTILSAGLASVLIYELP